jgi:hypothetical protein
MSGILDIPPTWLFTVKDQFEKDLSFLIYRGGQSGRYHIGEGEDCGRVLVKPVVALRAGVGYACLSFQMAMSFLHQLASTNWLQIIGRNSVCVTLNQVRFTCDLENEGTRLSRMAALIRRKLTVLRPDKMNLTGNVHVQN